MIGIGFAAYSGEPSREHLDKSKKFIEHLYRLTSFKNLSFLLGGYWGLMRYVVDWLREKKALIILFPPLDMEELEYPKDVIVLRLGLSMRMRSIPLVRSSDIFIILGGESGSILELVTAYTEDKHVFMLVGSGHSTDKFVEMAPYIDNRRITPIKIFRDPISMAEEVYKAIKEIGGGESI